MASFCSVFLYANNNKCGKRAESLSDCLSLQDELDAIYNWSLISHLSFNSGKFSLMSFCSSNCSPFDFPCTINGQGVLRYKTVRELDVIFSSSLYPGLIISMQLFTKAILLFITCIEHFLLPHLSRPNNYFSLV